MFACPSRLTRTTNTTPRYNYSPAFASRSLPMQHAMHAKSPVFEPMPQPAMELRLKKQRLGATDGAASSSLSLSPSPSPPLITEDAELVALFADVFDVKALLEEDAAASAVDAAGAAAAAAATGDNDGDNVDGFADVFDVKELEEDAAACAADAAPAANDDAATGDYYDDNVDDFSYGYDGTDMPCMLVPQGNNKRPNSDQQEAPPNEWPPRVGGWTTF